jgi:UDP-N-acetylmuramoyl-L-alanyl-D-glutamate--2,6-diaminopimelate ligase
MPTVPEASSTRGGLQSLAELVAGLDGIDIVRGAERIVTRVRVDSRQIRPGDLFVAIRGLHEDGVQYANEALARGAIGIVTARDAPEPPDGAWLVADEPRLAASLLASRAWGNPSEHLDVLGVTGTNGKTTTTFLLRAIGEAAGRKTGILGTLGAYLPDGHHSLPRTTPEAPDIQEALAAALQQGASLVAMEVSSHALDLRRADGIAFGAAAFLNLAPEHLDWHGTMEAYAESKQRLFRELLPAGSAPAGPRAVINGSDPWADHIRRVVVEALCFTAGEEKAAVTARGIRLSAAGSTFTLTTPAGSVEATLPLPGRHNVENALAAASLAHVMGIPLEAIVAGLASAVAPPGRFERVHAGTFDAFVDYAHTEDGLKHALTVARSLTHGRVILVLGCGGDRDQSKRPTMGRIAAQLADVAIFTTDNPRSEDPERIVEQMIAGTGEFRERVEIVMDRQAALERAVAIAGEGDLVIAAGKGHETYQTIRGVNHPFPEREILRRVALERDGRRR